MKFRVLFIVCVLAVGLTFSLRFFFAMKTWRERAAVESAPVDGDLRDQPAPEATGRPPAPPSPTPEPEEADAESTASVEVGVILADASGEQTAAEAAPEETETSMAAPQRASPALTYTEDWPRFLGPDATGISREIGLQLDWPETGPTELWRLRLGAAYSAPVAQGHRLIVFHRVGDRETLDCLDTRTGKLLWRYDYPTAYVDRFGFNGGPRSSPVIHNSRVYSFGAEGVLSCVDLETGKAYWQRDLNDEYGVPQNFFGVGVSPVIEGNLILLNLGAPDGAGIIALNKTIGATVWTATNDGASYSTPIVRNVRDERLAIFFTREGLVVLEPQSGEVRYDYEFRSNNEASVNAASPVIVGDVVFLSASYNVGAVALRLGATGLAEVWRDPRAMRNHWATSIYSDGFLYGMDGRHENGSNFRCIDFQTGSVQWTADRGLGRASFIMAEGHLIALGERGQLALIEARPDRYREKERVDAMSYPCWTPPILARGRLFLRGETELAAFDLRKTSYR